ncbi:hypothetical protein CI1B_20180 [Bradyrhizobium ivorense]|uniref:SGNH hydrolase-type esterase domain-containing protein n=1 Tax=Bradyrhizobium ivorense TaxID=2511166 RepID=A0A508T239_9BRAD|nr:hypothetical protein [Bradyrhizobium ivorense]VIO68231.1 hypothetical protein CI1B_20180 [Bradyrhizobium ivorense]
MHRALPWILTVVFLVGFVASFTELQRMRKRFGEVSQRTFHDHADVREFMIRAALADAAAPIVVLGDSITEMAPLPRELWRRLATRLLGPKGAFLVALTVGANDVGSATVQRDFAELIDMVKPLSTRPPVVAAVADARTNAAIGGSRNRPRRSICRS